MREKESEGGYTLFMVKPLSPNLKDKKRYIRYEVLLGDKQIKESLMETLGILGYGKAGIMMPKKQIMRCNANSLNEVKAALCMHKSVIKINKVSGNIKGMK